MGIKKEGGKGIADFTKNRSKVQKNHRVATDHRPDGAKRRVCG